MEKFTANIRKLKNPFRFLHAYGREEEDLFLGREDEIDMSYEIIRRSPMLLVFGEAGVGKTSLIQCGLANRFQSADWYDVLVLRKENINDSLRSALLKELEDISLAKDKKSISELVEALYLDTFKPVFLIFDQLEELYVNGSEDEIRTFYQTIRDIGQHRSSICKFIFVIRDDFHSQLHDFENNVGSLFSTALHVKRMSADKAVKAVQESLRQYEDFVEAEPNISYIAKIITDSCSTNGVVHLPRLQTLLYILWNEAPKHRDTGRAVFTESLVRDVSKAEDLLLEYVRETVADIGRENEGVVWQMLGKFISSPTTKRSCHVDELNNQQSADLFNTIALLKERQILRYIDADHLALTHDSLVPIIKKFQPADTRPRLTSPIISGNPYKGLRSYDESDTARFFGRGWVISEFATILQENKLLVVVGPSGSGKSSLIKAGLLPIYRNQQFHIISGKPGKDPSVITNDILTRLVEFPEEKMLIYIDQFEELSTQNESDEARNQFISFLRNLLEDDMYEKDRLKILLSIRSDYEHEFDKSFKEWRKMKRTVPDFSAQDIRDIIIEPAYYAGFEFRPPYLVDNIVREVMQSNGSLPLLSYTLSQMYEEYNKSGKEDFVLNEDHYNKIGGVVDGLRSRANEIFDEADDKKKRTIRNVMLRMVSLGIGERAGKRIYEQELVYDSEEENALVRDVLHQFESKRLILRGIDERGAVYYEPAHDSLIRAWDLIEDWIKKYGSQLLYLQRNLSAAVADFKKYRKLWHEDPRLGTLSDIMQSEDNWLNKDESEFVRNSVRKRIELNERNKRKQEEQLRLQAERQKLLEQNLRKEKKLSDTLSERVNLLNRSRRFFWIGLTLLVVLIGWILYLLNGSIQDRKMVSAALRKADTAVQEEMNARIALTQLNNLYKDQKELAESRVDIVNKSAEIAKRESNRSRMLAARLEAQVNQLNEANERLTMSNNLITEQKEQLRLALASREVEENRRRAAEMNAGDKALSAKWLQIARSNESASPALAYHIAQMAADKDSLNADAHQFLRSIEKKEGYYESVIIHDAESAIFSPDGRYFRTISQKNVLTVYDMNGKQVHRHKENGDILYAAFLPDGKSMLTTTNNSVSKYNLAGGGEPVKITFKSPAVQTVVSSTGNFVALIQSDKVHVYTGQLKYVREARLSTNTPILDAGANEEYILLKTAEGVHVIPAMKATRPVFIKSKQAWLFPNAEGLLTFNGTTLTVDYRKGMQVKNQPPHLPPDYTNIAAVSFSQDQSKILLTFEPDKQFPQQQQQQITKGIGKMRDTPGPRTYLYDLKSNRLEEVQTAPGGSASKSVLSGSGDLLLNWESGHLYIMPLNGRNPAFRFGGYDNYEYAAFNPANEKILLTKTNPTLAPSNSLLPRMNGGIKLWVRGTPATLNREEKLYIYNDEQMRDAGVYPVR